MLFFVVNGNCLVFLECFCDGIGFFGGFWVEGFFLKNLFKGMLDYVDVVIVIYNSGC